MSADLTDQIKQLLGTPEPPPLGPGPRAGVQTQAALNATLDSLGRKAKLPPARQQLLRALVLLWHDHLEAAHVIAQEIESADGSFAHAIMHRREPDYGNSKYWWRRVGKHPCFPEIARRVAELLESQGERDFRGKIVPHGEWDAFAFVDACEAAAGLPDSDEHVQLLRDIQRIESECALEHFLRAGD